MTSLRVRGLTVRVRGPPSAGPQCDLHRPGRPAAATSPGPRRSLPPPPRPAEARRLSGMRAGSRAVAVATAQAVRAVRPYRVSSPESERTPACPVNRRGRDRPGVRGEPAAGNWTCRSSVGAELPLGHASRRVRAPQSVIASTRGHGSRPAITPAGLTNRSPAFRTRPRWCHARAPPRRSSPAQRPCRGRVRRRPARAIVSQNSPAPAVVHGRQLTPAATDRERGVSFAGRGFRAWGSRAGGRR